MPWKYLRMTRRSTCDTLNPEEEENVLSGSPVSVLPHFFYEKYRPNERAV